MVVATNTFKGLACISAAKSALAKASTIDDVKEIRDKAEAIRMYVRAAGESLQVQNAAADIKLRAERKAGEMLSAMELKPGKKPIGDTMSLIELGIDKKQSSRWQLAASLPEDDYESLVLKSQENGTELTQSLVLRAAKGLAESVNEIKEPKSVTVDSFDLVGELRECISEFIDRFGSDRLEILHDVLCSETRLIKELIDGSN